MFSLPDGSTLSLSWGLARLTMGTMLGCLAVSLVRRCGYGNHGGLFVFDAGIPQINRPRRDEANCRIKGNHRRRYRSLNSQ